MPGKIRVATTSLATLEDVQPPYNLRHPTKQENLALGLSLLDAAGAQDIDLAVLPETFTSAGMPSTTEALNAVAEPIPGPVFDALAERARRYHMNVVAGLPVRQGDHFENVAVLIDRDGRLAGRYVKVRPTEREMERGVLPGAEAGVFDADFGRVGLSVCFDINWPHLWAEMADRGAELVCWLSAFPGGFPLQAYAWTHRYPIVASVWPYEARVVDFTGRILASGTRWGRVITCDLDLDRRLFHIGRQHQHILAIQTKYGPRVRVETYSEEHLFTLASNDPSLPVDEIVAEFGLVPYDDYIARCTRAQESALRAAGAGTI